MTKKVYDLRVNTGGGVQAMQHGYHDRVNALTLSKSRGSDIVIIDTPRAVYRVRRYDLNYPPLRVYIAQAGGEVI